MDKVIALLLSLTLFFLGWTSTAHAVIPASERAVLTNLYASTNGAGWTNKTNWNGEAGTECTWQGVTCDNPHSHVTAIALSINNLVGTLPSLSGLTALESFDVFNNKLSGSIPSLSGLTALHFFFVGSNQLSGSIPSLSGLTALQSFLAWNNQLSGSIPSLSGLTALQTFGVWNNQLSRSIPSLSGLTALQVFDVNTNQLSRSIPPSLSELTTLQTFAVYNNQLSGSIPSLSGLTALQVFAVNADQLTGPVPAPPPSLVLSRGASLCGNSLVSSGDATIDAAWVTATGTKWLACQSQSGVRLFNPMQQALESGSYTVDKTSVPTSGTATALSADGVSAVVVAYVSKDESPVKFSVSPYGVMTEFDSNYLNTPKPGSSTFVRVDSPAYPCDGTGCTYLALLWSPANFLVSTSVDLTVTAIQEGVAGAQPATGSLKLQPPPLLLVHGIWSSAAQAGFSRGTGGLFDWISSRYPHSSISPVDYGSLSYLSFSDDKIQSQFAATLRNLLRDAAKGGMAARQVDVIGHSMGGLVTRSFMSQKTPPNSLPPNVVHRLITVGTPHEGSLLTKRLLDERNTPYNSSWQGSKIVGVICLKNLISPCFLGNFFGQHLGKRIESGTVSLQPSSYALSKLSAGAQYFAIQGQAPYNSWTEWDLNWVISAFLEGESILSIIGTPAHDTIVSLDSQNGTAAVDLVPIDGIVHTAIKFSGDTGETGSQAVWNQAFFWLTGQQPPVRASIAVTKALTKPLPRLDLTGYTEVDGSFVSFSPPTGSKLTIGASTDILASSVSKTISTIVLFQTVVDAMDAPELAATESPFSIPFTPTRLGTADFVAFTLFSDMTYAVTGLSYPLQATGSPVSLSLGDDPDQNLTVGMTFQFATTSEYPGAGSIDVTNAATYAARSGTSVVFSVQPGGAITAIGSGVDWLDVSYLGLTASAKISVNTAPVGNADCLFSWAEKSYPALFAPAGATSTTSAPYYYRYYSRTDAYLGTSSVDNHVYYKGPATNNSIVDEGALTTWLATAGCQ